MAGDFKFVPWKRPAVLRLGSGAPVGGRLQGSLQLKVTETRDGAAIGSATQGTSFAFVGPRDVAELVPAAVLRTAPTPGDHQAETTKVPHVDFRESDYLWRYSPDGPAAGETRLRPWLLLLAGPVGQLTVKAGVAEFQGSLLADHDLTSPWTWGHVQSAGGREHSRLLCPRKVPLPPLTACTAAVVPAFDDAWGGTGWAAPGAAAPGVRCLFSWTFWTAEEGDFETLAAALRRRAGGDLGRATVQYTLPTPPVVELAVFGAIKPLSAPTMGAAPAGLDNVRDVVRTLVAVQPDDENRRPQIGLTLYGRPWVADPHSLAWGMQLLDDPRFRGTAGVGAGVAIDAQEKLLAAAVSQAGALEAARARVANLSLGDTANRALRTRLPDDPLAALWVVAPVMTRLAASTEGTVLDQATGGDSPLPAALFSSAARRILRRGGPATRYAAGPVTRADILTAANQCRNPYQNEPNWLPDGDALAKGLGVPKLADLYGMHPFPAKLRDFLRQFLGRPMNPGGVTSKVTDFLASLLGNPPVNPAVVQPELKTAWTPHAGQRTTEPMLLAPLGRFFEKSRDDKHTDREFPRPDPPPVPDPCRGRDLGELGSAVAGALNPDDVIGRVAGTIVGVDATKLAPPELPVVLEYPTWMLLKEFAPDWLLPGANTLDRDSVTALSSNPEFIDAFLIGLNTQFKAELHWRKLADVPTATTFALFWGTIRGDGLLSRRTPDVRPVTEWTSTPLGDRQHQYVEPDDPAGNRDLVIVFRSALFRRYPGTQVYLRTIRAPEDVALKAAPTFDPSAPNHDLGPIFQGSLGNDVVFYLFNVSPDDLKNYWVVLEESPADLRFRVPRSAAYPDAQAPVPVSTTSATFGQSTLDHPTRVAISWQSLGGS